MRPIGFNILVLILFTGLIACSQSNQSGGYDGDLDQGSGADVVNQGGGTSGVEGKGPTQPGVVANGSGQGREGGHYLICKLTLPLPYKNCSVKSKTHCQQEKVFFIDYFIMIDSQEDFDGLRTLRVDELAETRLNGVVARLKVLFKDIPHMLGRLLWASSFSDSFMEVKGDARWIEDDRAPHEIELTSDLAPENLTDDKERLVDKYCQGRFFQAAVYDSTRGKLDEVFEYSQFFETYASEMQKSFRNVHEMLRLVLKRGETKQIQSLTAYFHTEEFFSGDNAEVRAQIEIISKSRAARNPFYLETLPTKK